MPNNTNQDVNSGDNMPITLKDACAMLGNLYSISFLRKERDAGRLYTFRVGNRDLTTKADVREMVKKWDGRNYPQGLNSEPTKLVPHKEQETLQAGKLETEQAVSAQDALKAKLNAQMNRCKPILAKSKGPSNVVAIRPKSKSGTS